MLTARRNLRASPPRIESVVCPFDGCRLCHLSGIVGQSSSACAKNAGAEAFAGRFPVRAPLPVRVSIRQRLGPMSRWRSPTGAPLNTCDDRPRPRSGASSSAGDAARSRDWPLRPLPTASRHAPRGVAKLGLCPVVDRGHLLDQLLHTDLRQPTLQDLRDDRRVRRAVGARCVWLTLILHAHVPSGPTPIVASISSSPENFAVITMKFSSLTRTTAMPSPKLAQKNRIIGSACHAAQPPPVGTPRPPHRPRAHSGEIDHPFRPMLPSARN